MSIQDIPARSRGFSLVELMIAVGMMAIIGLSLAAVLKYSTQAAIKSREQSTGSNLSERFFARLNSIPYQFVFDMDSSSTNYRLNGTFGDVSTQANPYPYLSLLNDFNNLMRGHKFDKFTLSVRFMVRDLGDLNSDGKTVDLRYYTDSNANLIDDYDTALRYTDQNGDGDYYDFFGTPSVTEQPHTRLKECTFRLYKSSQVVFEETQLVSWEKLTGVEGRAAGASLTIVVSTPADNNAVYTLANASYTSSFNLVLRSSYPTDIVAVRSDSTQPLVIQGETTPNATFSWRLGTTTSTVSDTCTADTFGAFSCTVVTIAANLTEGTNTIWGQAYKTAYYSPWTPTSVIRDVSTPTIRGMNPTGTVPNLQPYVRALLQDNPIITGRTTSGINADVITMFITTNTASVNHDYDSSTEYVTWIDSGSSLPAVLSTGTYIMGIEGGDNAYYKVRTTWTFTISASTTDPTVPVMANNSPTGIAASNLPTISLEVSDAQSGIDISSLQLNFNGTIVVSSAIGNLAASVSPLSSNTGVRVSYTPPSPLPTGFYPVVVTVDHWANDPSSTTTMTDSWAFSVP